MALRFSLHNSIFSLCPLRINLMTTATLLLGVLTPVALIAFTLYSSFVLSLSKGMPGQACTE